MHIRLGLSGYIQVPRTKAFAYTVYIPKQGSIRQWMNIFECIRFKKIRKASKR